MTALALLTKDSSLALVKKIGYQAQLDIPTMCTHFVFLFCLYYFMQAHVLFMHSVFDTTQDANTLLDHTNSISIQRLHPFNQNAHLPTMSNLRDTDSASSTSSFVEMAQVKQDEMPNTTVKHLRTLCQGHIDNTLIERAMVTPQRKHDFIQAVKQGMTRNNLWLHSEETLMKELASFPPTHDQGGIPDYRHET